MHNRELPIRQTMDDTTIDIFRKSRRIRVKSNKKEYVHGFDIIEVPKSLIEKINFPMFETNLKKAIEKQSVEIAPPNITEALYRCPICKQYANADSKAKLFCGYCNTEMIRIEQKNLSHDIYYTIRR